MNIVYLVMEEIHTDHGMEHEVVDVFSSEAAAKECAEKYNLNTTAGYSERFYYATIWEVKQR